MWAGIKHALNSTLGTSNFKPLDQLIAEERDLVASDNLYKYFHVGSKDTVTVANNDIEVFNFVSKRNGSIRIKSQAITTTSGNNVQFRIYEDNVLLYEESFFTTLKDISTDIQINKEKNYKIALYSKSQQKARLTNTRICANELDISGIEIMEV